MSVVPVDTTSTVAITDYLTQCRDWLATCVEMSGPEQIAAAKAEIATAAEATKQLGLSKEIQLDAQEMVRRAEYALGRAIRKGQAEGAIRQQGHQSNSRHVDELKSSPYDFASHSELWGTATGGGIAHLADASAEQFDDAIGEAKAEGNLSRANVARKAREIAGKPPPATGAERNHQEAELVNAITSIVRPLLNPNNVSNLSPKARRLIVERLENAIASLKGTDQ